ncbi:hypothetical protein [Embleya sp. NPDC059259]|uniref:hypothetical protein n=1 Tax=unclassified Embleya TaxID=2699296 RepID=UPI0036C2C453
MSSSLTTHVASAAIETSSDTPEELDALTAHDNLEELFVSPRHLAGPRADGDEAIKPLLDAGWSHRYDDLGNLYVDSPCMRVRARR